MVSKFMKVKCKCKNEQVIFEKASTEVRCLVCGETIAVPTGGRCEVKAEVVEVYE